jgi:uracil phosphoribosyltransferase
MPLHESTHPLIAAKMTKLRDANTPPDEFRRKLREISFYLGFEATRNLSVVSRNITTPMGIEYEGSRIADTVAIIPILRAGLSMADGMLELMPNAAVHHIGTFCDIHPSVGILFSLFHSFLFVIMHKFFI